MGLLINDPYTLENGVTITNYYLYIDGVNVMKSPIKGLYGLSCDVRTYATQDSRNTGKQQLDETKKFGISTNDLTNLHQQLYSQLKLNYIDVSDVFESEESNTTPESTTV